MIKNRFLLLLLLVLSCSLYADSQDWLTRIEMIQNTPKFVGRSLPSGTLTKAKKNIQRLLACSVPEANREYALNSWIIYLEAAALIELQQAQIADERDPAIRKQHKIALTRFVNTLQKIEEIAEKGHQAALAGTPKKSKSCYQAAEAYLRHYLRSETPHESTRELIRSLEKEC